MHLIVRGLAALFLLSSLTVVKADVEKAYDGNLYERLTETGEVVLVDIYASWCPTCAKQQKVLQDYINNNPDKKFHILKVDFDTQKEVVKKFQAPRQSTLILFVGHERYWFSVAETRYEKIAEQLDQAIAEAKLWL